MTTDKQCIFHPMEYYTVVKTNGIQLHITGMNLSDIMLSDQRKFQQTLQYNLFIKLKNKKNQFTFLELLFQIYVIKQKTKERDYRHRSQDNGFL